MDKLPNLNIAVDRPCDIHLIEALARGLKRVPHCAEWGNVGTHHREGVLVMDCPQPMCAPTAEDIEKKCNLQHWEDLRLGESLWPIPARKENHYAR